MHIHPPKWDSYRGQRGQGSYFHTRSSPATKPQTRFCGGFAPVLSSLASANPHVAAQGSHGQRPPCRHIFNGQKGPSFHVTFIIQSGQTTLANSSSSQPDRLLCWKDFFALPARPWQQGGALGAQQDTTVQCHLITLFSEKQGTPCFPLLTNHKK